MNLRFAAQNETMQVSAETASDGGWAWQDSNLRPRDYESPALSAELQAPNIITREFSASLRHRQPYTPATCPAPQMPQKTTSPISGHWRC